MNVTDTIYSLDVVKDLPDEELYQRLFKSWNITDDKIEVWGELQIIPFSDFIKLFNVKTITENRKVNYPFQARHDIDHGIYIPLGNAKALLNGQATVWIKCELELSPLNDRQKHNNPFELSVKRGSGERLVSLPLFDKSKILDDEASSYVSEAIYDFHLSVANEKISKAKASIELELKTVETKNNQASADLKQLVEQNEKLEISNTELKSGISIQQEELKSLIHQYQKVELEMVSKIDKLKSYITEKALFLKSFEFIDEEDFDSFIVNTEKEHNSTNMLSFSDVLDGNCVFR
jgi:FtsZ-binding cell division protein ZapB